jgi:trimethylamine--corrinoid protein Co-methyltransferase
MMGVMAGADLVDLFAGTIESFRTASYEQLVIDNELAGMALRCAEGIEVNAETLARDVIDRVGPDMGQFCPYSSQLNGICLSDWLSS